MPFGLGFFAVAGAGAAGGASSFDLLETVTPSGTDLISFTGLGSYSAYKHLQLRMTLRNTSGTTAFDGIQIQMNSDTGSNYTVHELRGFGGLVGTSATINDSGISLSYCYAGGSSGSNIFGALVADILDFNVTTKNKTVRSLSGVLTSSPVLALESGVWRNTAAITSLQVSGRGRNFASGTRISLYGIK